MEISVNNFEGRPSVAWRQEQPLIEKERFWEGLPFIAAPGVLLFALVAINSKEFPPLWGLLVFLLFGSVPGAFIYLFLAMPILRNARYAKYSMGKATPRLIQRKPVYVMGLETVAGMMLLPGENKVILHYAIPVFILYAREDNGSKFQEVDADEVVDFTVHDGAAWMNIQGMSFSIIVMRMKDGNTYIVALHYGGQGMLFPLQQTLMEEFITKRPRGGWAGQKQAAEAAQRRIDNDTI